MAVYTPALELETSQSGVASIDLPTQAREDDLTVTSLALAEAVNEAGRHAASVAAAAVLETVAHRLRAGEILLPSGDSHRNDAAVVASVLTALLGDRR